MINKAFSSSYKSFEIVKNANIINKDHLKDHMIIKKQEIIFEFVVFFSKLWTFKN